MGSQKKINENPENKKGNYLHNLKMATLISLGLAAGEGKAQTTQPEIIPSQDMVVVSQQESINAVRNLDTIFKSAHMGDMVSVYNNEVEKIINQNIKLNKEQVSYIFDDLLLKFMELPKNHKLIGQIAEVNNKLIEFIYKEKSPFCLEDNDKKIISLQKELDSTLPEGDARVLFNHVLSEKFNSIYSKKDSLIQEKDKDHNVTMGILDFKNEDETVSVSLNVEMSDLFVKENSKSYVKQFRVSVIKDGQYHSYFFLSGEKVDDNDSLPPNQIQEIFDSLISK